MRERERVLSGRWRLKAACRFRRSSGEEEEEDDSWFKMGRTRLFGGLSGGTGRLASLSMAGSQLHLRFATTVDF